MTEHVSLVLVEQHGRRVVAVRGADGRCEAKDFIDELPVEARLDFEKIMDRLTSRGMISNTEFFRRIQGAGTPPVWEMKSHEGKGFRLYCIQSGPDWWVTHGKKKPKDRLVLKEAARAQKLFKGRV